MSYLGRIAERKAKGNSRKISDRQEKQVAKRLGGRVHIASGALPMKKSDLSTSDFQIECKTTAAGSHSVKVDILAKVTLEASQRNRRPALSIRFEGEKDPNRDWILVRLCDFEELIAKEQV